MSGGKNLFLLLVDVQSRFMWISLPKSKSDAAAAIKQIHCRAEAECGKKLRVLRTDRGGEFMSRASKTTATDSASNDTSRHPTPPSKMVWYVEHQNQSVIEMARALLMIANMPRDFWGEAVVTAVYIFNRAPTRSLEVRTPYEVWHGKKPSVHHMHTFGCVVYVKDTKPHLAKLDAWVKKGVFIGYETWIKAYGVFDLVENRVHVSRDVAFDENNF
jgi:hypothetical protein